MLEYVKFTFWLFVGLIVTPYVTANELEQYEANRPLQPRCRLLDGVYYYYEANEGPKVGFNAALRKPSVYGDIRGVDVSHTDDRLYLSITIFGLGLKSALDVSLLEKVVSYSLPVTCQNGKWVYQTRISGSSEGTPVKSNELFYFDADSAGALVLRNQSEGSARLGGFIPRHWEGERVYRFQKVYGANH